jgi:LysR family transcriptional regulator, low CO2-responsive transcriptional regulator
LTLHQLQIFDAVAKHLSVSKASRELRISQPSLSKQLQSLEEEFGVKFHKQVIGRGIKLTEDGHAFWSEVQPILRHIERLKLRFSQQIPLADRLVVGATQGPSVSFVPDALKIFWEHYPHVRATLRTGESRHVEQMLLNSEVEMATVMYPSYHPRIHVEPLRPIQISAIVSRHHPLARKKKIDQSEILKTPFIIKTGGKIAHQLKQLGIHIRIAIQCDSIEGIKAAVESGIGIGLIYRENVERGLHEGEFKALSISWLYDPRLQLCALYLKSEALSTNAERFLEILRGLLKSKKVSENRQQLLPSGLLNHRGL